MCLIFEARSSDKGESQIKKGTLQSGVSSHGHKRHKTCEIATDFFEECLGFLLEQAEHMYKVKGKVKDFIKRRSLSERKILLIYGKGTVDQQINALVKM
jgi:hypothetical protein